MGFICHLISFSLKRKWIISGTEAFKRSYTNLLFCTGSSQAGNMGFWLRCAVGKKVINVSVYRLPGYKFKAICLVRLHPSLDNCNNVESKDFNTPVVIFQINMSKEDG